MSRVFGVRACGSQASFNTSPSLTMTRGRRRGGREGRREGQAERRPEGRRGGWGWSGQGGRGEPGSESERESPLEPQTLSPKP